MGRPVKIRANFRTDAAFLIRFEDAVSKDTSLSEPQRTKMVTAAHELAKMCMEADTLRKKDSPKK